MLLKTCFVYILIVQTAVLRRRRQPLIMSFPGVLNPPLAVLGGVTSHRWFCRVPARWLTTFIACAMYLYNEWPFCPTSKRINLSRNFTSKVCDHCNNYKRHGRQEPVYPCSTTSALNAFDDTQNTYCASCWRCLLLLYCYDG
jgi:hypothetical protein